MTSTELAWAAGFFDGDGNVYYSESAARSPRLIVQIDQVYSEPLERFSRVVGCGNVTGPYSQKNVNANPYYKYSVEGYMRPVRVYGLLQKYLCSRKSDAFEKAISKYNVWRELNACSVGHELKEYGGNKSGLYCPACRSEAAKNRKVKV